MGEIPNHRHVKKPIGERGFRRDPHASPVILSVGDGHVQDRHRLLRGPVYSQTDRLLSVTQAESKVAQIKETNPPKIFVVRLTRSSTSPPSPKLATLRKYLEACCPSVVHIGDFTEIQGH